MEEPIKDPLDVSNELAEREKQQQQQQQNVEKKSDNDVKLENESEQRPHSTELVILNPSDVIVDKITDVSDSGGGGGGKSTENKTVLIKPTNETTTTKTDANRNEVKVENVSFSNLVTSPPSEIPDDSKKDEKTSNSSEKTSSSSVECVKVVDSTNNNKNSEETKPEEIQNELKSSKINEIALKENVVDDNNGKKVENEVTVNVQNDENKCTIEEKQQQQQPEKVVTSESCNKNTSNEQQPCNSYDYSKQHDSDGGNNSVLKQSTGSTNNNSSVSSNEPKNDENCSKSNEEEEVSVSFLDRVIKHALNNTLPIGNFDSSKPFDMVNRRPGGLPNFNHRPPSVTSTNAGNDASNNKSNESASGGVSGETVSCDNDKEQTTTSDLKGNNNPTMINLDQTNSVNSSSKGTVSVQFLANSSKNLSMQATMSENQNKVDSNDKIKLNENNEISGTKSHSVQQSVVTSSVATNMSSVQSMSQVSQHENTSTSIQPSSSSIPNTTKTEFTRQEIIDSKYKTKNDLKNARLEAARQQELSQNEQTLDLSVSQSGASNVPASKKPVSLYVSNPDFSKKIFTAPEISIPTTKNPLHVRPPDFNRSAIQTKELQIPNPVFKLKGGNENTLYHASQQNIHSVPMTQEQLAELSKTHNYIPDLRLKSQPPTAAPIPVIHAAPSVSSLKHKPSIMEEEPLPHVIHKIKYEHSLQNTSIIPVRIEPKVEPTKSFEPKVHYPPFKQKSFHETQPPQMHAREHVMDIQPDIRHVRMESKDISSQKQNLNYSAIPKVPHIEMNKHQSYMYKVEDPKFHIQARNEKQQRDNEFSVKEREKELRKQGTFLTTLTPTNEEKHISPIPNTYHMQQPPSGSSNAFSRPPEPAKLTKENVDRHLRETKHLYPPGHPSLTALAKEIPMMKQRIVEPPYQKPEHHLPEPHKSSGYYSPYGDSSKGPVYQKHPSYVNSSTSIQKSGSSEVAYYPHPSVSPHGPISRPPVGSMNPPVNWPNQRMAPSPHTSNISPISNIPPTAQSPVFIHPSSKHSPSPTQFSRPPVAQSPTHSNKSVSPQLIPHPNQYRQVSYSPVHMQQKPGPSMDDKYRQNERRHVESPSMPPRQVVVYETGHGQRKYEYTDMPKNQQMHSYPQMKYNQQQPHEGSLRHSSQENLNRSSRDYEMHKYPQYGPSHERVDFRRSENDLSRSNYANEPPLHKRDDYRSHSLDRAAYERQKEYEYRSRMPSSSPTESYKIQLDISAAIKHETNRSEQPTRHHESYHSGPTSRTTMEVQSNPSPSHYQASILIRPSPSTSRLDATAPHIKAEAYVPPKEMRSEPAPTVIATPVAQSRPSVLTPVMKRESPLDLSVKTVKTKADSTGSDLSQQMYRRVDDRYVLPKVEFHPNFTPQQQQPLAPGPPSERSQSDHFDPRHPVHLRETQQQHSVSSNINQKYGQGNTNSMPPHHPNNQRMSEIPNPKYYEQSGHRSQEPSIIPPHQPNDRTIHIAVGEPYRHDMQINSQRQMHRQDTINSRHTPYPMNERPGTSSTKPQPIHSQSRGSVINNPNDPQRLEDRKYVESILYKKQPPPSAIANAEITFRYVHDKHGRPISPRKRSSEYNENVHIPPKQVRYDTLHREMPPHPQGHMNQGSQPSNYPPYSEPKSMYPREPVVEIHAHKMIFERYPPESRTLHSPHQYPKSSNDDRQRPNIYPDPRQPESKSHATVVKTIPKDSFRHDPKDEPRAGFPPPPDTQKSYPPSHMPYYPRPKDNVSNNVDLSIQSKQTAVTWHPSVSPSQSRISQQTPDRYDIRNQYNARADALDTEKREQIPIPRENHSSPNIVIEPKVVPQHSGSPGGSNAINASKGADINTINKLRTSIEQKEIERQRLMMKKQNSSEMSEDDSNKADIASILAARIRTKGELKGFTPVPVIETPRKESPVEIPKDPIEPPADIEGTTPFDVMDWGNACNDFVDQLQTGKKRGRRKRPLKEVDRKDIKIDPYTNTNANAENLSNVPVEVLKSIQETGALSNSSDEDKPLKLLRQQSTPECKDEDSLGPRKGSETCSSAIKCGALGERTSQSLRKKQRLVLEQKIAARIGTGSSSDTEPEDKPSVRTKKRKLRTRSSLGMKESEKSNNERSDTKQNKTDDESSSDEKITKTISQLDGSSDSDNQDKSSRKRLSSRNRSHVDNKSKHSEHSESERRKSLSKSKSSKSKSKNSDSESQKEETMTRSKRKLEMEKKISNSKVLRNDKIVQNKTVKKPKNVQEVASKANNTKTQLEKNASNKKKDDSKNEAKRKHLESDCEQNKSKTGKRMTRNLSKIESSESSSEEEDAKTDRLRPRKAKTTPSKEEVVGIKRKNSKVEEDSKKSTPHKKSSQKPENPVKEKYPPGWEAQLYAFKKSLKIPARLINVTPNNQRYSTSLPDLDPHSSDASEFSETSKTSSLQTQIKTEDNENDSTPNHKKPSKKSIIDLLHQRVTPSMNKMMQKKKKGESVQVKSSENDLLPTPVVEKNEKQTTSVKKNIFDLSILKTRTRNEQKHMKHKEIIREIFCGEDRPSSAPPLGLDLNTTFDQKFGQIMKKMDDVVASTSIVIKQEKPDDTFIPPHDEETTDTVLNVNNDLEDSHDRDLDTPSVNSERDIITPTSFKEMPKPAKKGRVSRRKQSSGFDYIRKKKKPVTNVDGTPVPSKRRIAAVNYLQEKDENDISKEVKGWVLNKGVGESYLHKAARLGYLDVIAYCLFRIDMDVDTKDNAGYTALHEACTRGNLGIVRLLLQCGANHSVTAFSGIRPLHEAVQHNYIEIARLLLAYGADPSLSTYSGQTPETLAETKEMTDLLNYYLKDMQGVSCPPWRFNPPWQQYDSDSDGLDNFDGVSELFNDTTPERIAPVKTISKTCDSNLNNNIIKINDEKIKYKSCSVVLNNIDHLKSFNSKSLRKSIDIIDSTIKSQFSDLIPTNPESDGELFEFEETDYPLPPLYLLQNEGSDKWIMLTDLCNILKVKSKDAVLKQIDPTIPTATLNKELIRELKINEFIEKATCLQLLCAGEKLNVRASKVVLVRYNEAVKKLMNIQTIVLKF